VFQILLRILDSRPDMFMNSRGICQEPHACKGGGLSRWGGFCPSSLQAYLTRPSQGEAILYRATISARFKNVPRDARPVSCSTTCQLTRCTRVKPVLRGYADRYHRRGQHYPGNRWGFERSHSKRSPERGWFWHRRAQPSVRLFFPPYA
jgi:hypothetical protein